MVLLFFEGECSWNCEMNMFEEILNHGSEDGSVDYKLTFDWKTAQKFEKCEIIKDILAFSNTKDGGTLVFGVEDETQDNISLSEESFASFDNTLINEFLYNYCDPKINCKVTKKQSEKNDMLLL